MQIFKLDACREKMSCLKYPIITRVELFTSPHQPIQFFCVKLHKEKTFLICRVTRAYKMSNAISSKIFCLMMKVEFYFHMLEDHRMYIHFKF